MPWIYVRDITYDSKAQIKPRTFQRQDKVQVDLESQLPGKDIIRVDRKTMMIGSLGYPSSPVEPGTTNRGKDSKKKTAPEKPTLWPNQKPLLI